MAQENLFDHGHEDRQTNRTGFAVDPKGMARDTRWFDRELIQVLWNIKCSGGTEDEAVWDEEEAGDEEADDELENEFDTDSEEED